MDKMNESLNCGINDVLNEEELSQIFSYFAILERIDLRSVCNKWQNIIDNTFKCESVLNCNTVKSYNRWEITINESLFIIEKCFNAKHIDFKCFGTKININLENNSIFMKMGAYYEYKLFQKIAQNCKHLETINFANLDIIEDLFLSHIEYFSQLKKIICENITEKAFNSIIVSQNLQSIDISHNFYVKRSDLRRMGPKIKELYLMNSELIITENMIRNICNGNGIHLTHLSFDLQEINVWPHICSQMKELKSLKIGLNVANCDFTLLSKLKSLESFSITVRIRSDFNCKQFRDIVRSLKSNNLLEFEIIFFHFRNTLNTESLYELSNNCGKLEKLVIRSAKSITSDGLQSIANMKALKHLDLMDCESIDDEIQTVINSCPLLTHLVLENCKLITVSTVHLFIAKAKSNRNQQYFVNVFNTFIFNKRNVNDFNCEKPYNLEIKITNNYRYLMSPVIPLPFSH